MKEVAERMKVPRALHTAFPVGRSLGKPGDKQFQHEVLRAAFSLLNESNGPVIREFPYSISSTGGEPLVCSLPPRMDTDLHPNGGSAVLLTGAVIGLVQGQGFVNSRMQISAGQVPEALERFVRIVDGEHWDEVGFPAGSMYGTVHDIRAYYEELACELAEGPIEPWATEEWFYDGTEAGRLILEARRAMRDREADQAIWFGLAPAGRP